jgi:uncharacterized protein YbjT (DUF2867 family)
LRKDRRPQFTALLAGATGLVGSECLSRLLAEETYTEVLVVTRRDLGPGAADSRIRQIVIDFDRLDELPDALVADQVFCTLGTTMRKAGSRAQFRRVDLEYPLKLAEIALRRGAGHFSLVSAMGASRSSPLFYLRVKGELELALRNLGWPSLAIFRPSVIAGQRKESRPGERAGELLLRMAPARLRPVAAGDIATAMVVTALQSPTGVTIVESDEISRRAAG